MRKTAGEMIRQRRLELHMSQEELAKKTGYSDKTAISKIESSKRDLSQTKIMTFAKALRTSPLYLLGYTEDPTPHLGLSTQSTRLLIDRFESASEDTQRAICLLLGIDYASLQG